MREEKDAFFRISPDSPIPDEERRDFRGLRYFDPDPAWRVRARWEPNPAPRPAQVHTSTGEVRDYLEAGTLVFHVAEEEQRLTGYVPARGHAHELFVPFRDATSGKESYGAARYLEAELPHGDETVIDFNLAYNPFCAYNDAYSCPLPPRQNWLQVPVRAGERSYRDE